MTHTEFEKKLAKSTRPVVVEFWAPWCGPCRMMAPALEQAKKTYQGKVDLWRINADQEPEILRSLRVMGIPTMIGYQGGKQIVRKTGAQSLEGVNRIFEAALNGEPIKKSLTPIDRFLRLGIGIALAVLTWQLGWSFLWFIVAGGLAFSAVYDRCPIYKAIAPRILSLFRRSN